jgi:diguanylate cyclase
MSPTANQRATDPSPLAAPAVPQALDALAEAQWLALVDSTSPEARALLQAQATALAPALADTFYGAMLADPHASGFLSHEAVNTRLRASMQRWVRDLMSAWDERSAQELMALQRHVGAVHARIGVRMELVMRGARLIKRGLGQGLLASGAPTAVVVDALVAGCALIDLALEMMSGQYSTAHETAARADEAYRTFASSMNMSLERERQRTALLDWQYHFLQSVMTAVPGESLPQIGQSSFGLWIHHKAVAIFSRSPELDSISQAMERIDRALLPLCQRAVGEPRAEELRRLVRSVTVEVDQIRYLKDTLFDHLVDLEAGRDALTQLLNRRFLPSILSREVELSRRANKPFSLLLIDVDHFKDINDQHGHDAGDRVLQHLANVLVNVVRSGDFVFRYGGEEFLIISVEITPEQALQVAEKIRRAVENEAFLLSNGRTLRATISVGVAPHTGHPDYQHLIERADLALYAAKQAGRNRCIVRN